ncbi:MAG: hypothetical protein GX592_15230 [Clostridiales bacterium]|nr:hypothetical protein [Clostridiales bacterium]
MRTILRILAIMMALALLGGALTSAESAATWSNGQSPQQPYKGVPPVDLTKKLGYMVLDPLNNENVDTAINSLIIYLPRTDVQAGDGALRLYEKGVKAPIQEVSFADSARVTVAPIDADTLAWLFWESGVQFTVAIDNSLDGDKTYTASLDPNCIVAPEYGVGNSELNGAKGWTFTTKVTSGVLKLKRSGQAIPRVGDSVAVEVRMGEGAASAMIFSGSDALTSEDEPLTQSGTLTGHYAKEGPVDWGVALMDASGQFISIYHYKEEILPQAAESAG